MEIWTVSIIGILATAFFLYEEELVLGGLAAVLAITMGVIILLQDDDARKENEMGAFCGTAYYERSSANYFCNGQGEVVRAEWFPAPPSAVSQIDIKDRPSP